MAHRHATKVLFALALVGIALSLTTSEAGAETLTRVWINGEACTVSFNDGDSFRPRDGRFHGSQCRLGGYNALESFGPAHQWGDWHPYELYINAKEATHRAQRGRWHCFGDGSTDGYGRVLLDCPDLAVDLISHGLAVAYQVDDTPSRPEYIRAQQDAIEHRRGMWAHGVPEFVMTSVHSFDEDRDRPWHYNRMVSTRDGHTESMQHRDTYSQCQWICNTETRSDADAVHEAARALRADPTIAPLVADDSNILLETIIDRFVRRSELPGWVTGEAHDALLTRLTAERDAGHLGTTHEARGSCMIYVPFEQRYGVGRAACLHDHGTLPPDLADRWHASH